MATEEMKLKYLRLYADDNGETHLEEEEMVMTEVEYAPPAPPNWLGPREKATGLTVIGLPPSARRRCRKQGAHQPFGG